MEAASPSTVEFSATPPRRGALLKLAAFVVLVVGAFFVARALGWTGYAESGKLAESVHGLRERRYIVPLFIAAYVAATAVGLPGSILTIAGGAIFGFGLGSVVNWTGALLGAIAAYLLARSLGLDAVRRLVGVQASRLDLLSNAYGFITVLRLRLIPVVPFNILNFGAGLAGVPFRDYALGTALGLIPGTLVYTYFADALLAGAGGARRTALVRLAVAGALLVGLTFAPAVWSRLRRRTA